MGSARSNGDADADLQRAAKRVLKKHKERLSESETTVERTGRAICTLRCLPGLTFIPGGGYEMTTFWPHAKVTRMKNKMAWRSFGIIMSGGRVGGIGGVEEAII